MEDALSRCVPAQQVKPRNEQTQKPENTQSSFDRVFEHELAKAKELTFSKHAGERMKERGIDVTAEELERLGNAVKKAGKKGVQTTLVLAARNAYIVNVPSATVVTVMGEKDLNENVFTKIDGAVIL
jgi:flagellar operon protein